MPILNVSPFYISTRNWGFAVMMPNDTILGAVSSICGISVGESELDVALYEIGFDSLAMSSLLLECEKKFGVALDDAQLQAVLDSQSIRELLVALSAAGIRDP